MEAARSEHGILSALENAEAGLRSHSGFDDLRVSVSPAESGASQALAETTWATREAFAGYDSAKDTLLDLIGTAGDQVVPGSVQAFDMNVIRDTKESPIRFTLLHGVVALIALVVGGLRRRHRRGSRWESGGTAVAAVVEEETFAIIATDNAFDRPRNSPPEPESAVTFALTNDGAVLHNLAFYDEKGGEPLAEGSIGEFTAGGSGSDVNFHDSGRRRVLLPSATFIQRKWSEPSWSDRQELRSAPDSPLFERTIGEKFDELLFVHPT